MMSNVAGATAPGMSERASCSATRSSETVMMGMVFVARCMARVSGSPAVRMTSGLASTTATAAASARPNATPNSPTIERLLPSVKPARCNSSNNATQCAASRADWTPMPRRYVRPASCAQAADDATSAAAAPASIARRGSMTIFPFPRTCSRFSARARAIERPRDRLYAPPTKLRNLPETAQVRTSSADLFDHLVGEALHCAFRQSNRVEHF
jgi:hypothetical protein